MDEKMETAALKQELATAKHELAEARAYIRRRILAEADHAREESLARKIKHCDEIMEERDQALKERDEARAEVGMLEDRLSESRAEVDRLTDERDELLVRVANQDAELRATREAYRESQAELTRERIGIRPVDEVRSDAYRRGAEAMREAIASHVRGPGNELIRAWRIPEEP